jgi:uncharacterized protein YbjT (DUF2867 family)
MVTILGAGGAIGSELVKEFTGRNEPVRLVSRNPQLVPGATEAVAADLSNLDAAVRAVAGSRIAFPSKPPSARTPDCSSSTTCTCTGK